MNTRWKSRRRVPASVSEREENVFPCDSGVVKRIDFDEPLRQGLRSPREEDFTQHDVVTLMETIPKVTAHQKHLNTTHQNGSSCNQLFDELRDKHNGTAGVQNEKFVSAEEFFSKAETREKLTSDYFSGSDSPAKLRESTRRLSLRKPLNRYISYSSDEELDDWWGQPKTDYTYSESLSYRDRVSPERKIGSPNMSRKGLRGSGVGTMTSPPFSLHEIPTSASDRLTLRSRDILRAGLGAFSDESDGEVDLTLSSKSKTNKWNEALSSHRSRSTITTTTDSIIQYGLDADSETEEESSRFARPLVRKRESGTSFLRGLTPSTIESNSTSINGRNHALMGNNINVKSSSSHKYSQQRNGGRGYRLNQFENTEEERSWIDKFSEWSHYSWTRTCQITTIVCASFILCTSSALTAMKTRFSRQNRSHLGIRKSDENRKTFTTTRTTTTLTTTTVMSRMQTIYTFSENLLGWYKEKRRQSPCVWGWLPLLLLLLLLIPLLAHFFWGYNHKDPIPSIAKSQSTWMHLASNNLKDFPSQIFTWGQLVWSYLSYSVIYLGKTLLDSIFYCWENLKYLVFVSFDALRTLFIWLSGFFSHFFTLFGVGKPSSSNATQSDSEDSHWDYASAPLTVLSNGYSVFKEGVASASNTASQFVDVSSAYTSSGLSTSWNAIAWLGLSVWHMISYLLSSIWLFIGLIFNYLLSGISEIGSLLIRFIMFLPLYLQQSTKATSARAPLVTPSAPASFSSQTSSEELVEQILRNPQLQSVISLTLQESLNQNDISKESLSSVIKLNIETEVGKIRSEMLESKRFSESEFSTSKEEIGALKTQQGKLLYQLGEMEASLKRTVLHLDNLQESADSKAQLEKVLSEVSLNIEKLSKQFDNLETNHESLAAEVRSCCRNASVTLEQVERHVTLLLSDLVGLSPKEEEENVLASRLKAWLKSYFVSKEELEGRLAGLWERVQSNPENSFPSDDLAHEETVKQTSDMVMGRVLDLLRVEMKEQIRVQTKEAQEGQIQTSLRQVSETAATVLSQMNEASEAKRNEIKSYVEEEMAQLKTIASNTRIEVAESIQEATDEAMEKSVPEIMESRMAVQIEESLDAKLPSVIESLVAETINNKIEVGLNEIVDQKVSLVIEQNQVLNLEKKEAQSDHGLGIGLSGMVSGLNESDVERIVKRALLVYDADKTGMVDHALESGGGSIVSTRCTDSYQGHQAELTLFGYSMYRYSTNTPRSVIQPDRNPGQCYAFKGSQGYIVIQFAGPVRMTAFTVEHIPKSLTPAGSIDSAPREFSVYGLKTTNEEGFHLGNFVFREDGEPLQYFPVQNMTDEYFEYVELKIHSNHGNLQYTCLYRFRVHGLRQFS